MTDILKKIGFGKSKQYKEGINFFERKVEEQLARKKLPLSSIFIITATKFADFLSDIYDAFNFEIKLGDETHGYI